MWQHEHIHVKRGLQGITTLQSLNTIRAMLHRFLFTITSLLIQINALACDLIEIFPSYQDQMILCTQYMVQKNYVHINLNPFLLQHSTKQNLVTKTNPEILNKTILIKKYISNKSQHLFKCKIFLLIILHSNYCRNQK